MGRPRVGKPVGMRGAGEAGKALVRRYYRDLWNGWDDRAIDELIAPHVSFRGSLGTTVRGIEEFRTYVARVRAAFPDFHNKIDDLIAEGDKIVAVLTYTGTHCGELFGIPPTGKLVSYRGIAVFRTSGSKIVHGFVLGDTQALISQLKG